MPLHQFRVRFFRTNESPITIVVESETGYTGKTIAMAQVHEVHLGESLYTEIGVSRNEPQERMRALIEGAPEMVLVNKAVLDKLIASRSDLSEREMHDTAFDIASLTMLPEGEVQSNGQH